MYLATEEESIFEMLANSELKDPQGDPFKRTLDYIVTLEGLTRCDALLADIIFIRYEEEYYENYNF